MRYDFFYWIGGKRPQTTDGKWTYPIDTRTRGSTDALLAFNKGIRSFFWGFEDRIDSTEIPQFRRVNQIYVYLNNLISHTAFLSKRHCYKPQPVYSTVIPINIWFATHYQSVSLLSHVALMLQLEFVCQSLSTHLFTILFVTFNGILHQLSVANHFEIHQPLMPLVYLWICVFVNQHTFRLVSLDSLWFY